MPNDDSDWPGESGSPEQNKQEVHQPPPTAARRILKAIIFAVLGLIALVVLGLVALYITCSGQNSW